VAGLTSGVSAITAGASHTCALTDTGGAACWGVNRYGQLGDGTEHGRSTPTAVSDLGTGVVSVSAGKYHTCALTDAGGVRCWGYNGEGELGDGTRHDRSTATRVLGLASGIAEVSAGGFHTCALTDVGTAACWGWNQSGLLGDGTTVPRRLRPVAVDGLRHLMAVAAGGAHSCALTVAGAMTCWGENDQLQLGDGTTVNRRHPVGVVGLGRGVSAIALGSSHTCAVTTVGRVACWGTNHYGKLGDGTLFGRMIPVTVRGFTAGPGTYRPDASIAKMPPSPWVGGDALDPSGKAQTVSVRVQPGGTGTTRVRIQNDGDRLDQFFLEGTGGREGFAVRYRSDAEIVTGEITGARFWVGRPPGEAFALHIQVAVGSAVPDGAHLVVFLACRSAHESEVVDAVRMEIEIVSSTRAVGGRGA
jgi:hypothetical protein